MMMTVNTRRAMRRRNVAAISRALCSFALLFLFIAWPALAAQEERKPVEGPIGAFYKWLNFAIVFSLLAWLMIKKAPPFFRKRTETIASAITESTLIREQAEQQRREAEARLAGLEHEISELRAAAQNDALAETARLRAATQQEAAKIARMADAEIQAAGRAAAVELKIATARLAVARAEALLRAQMNPASESSLLRGFLADLAGGVN